MTKNTHAILVVDDDPQISETVAEILNMEGYQVRTAGNGEEALAAVASGMPSLVLLDMRMPRLDGWGFAAELQRRNVSLPLLVMTAAQDAAQWAREIGAAGSLAKPFNVNELLAAVERLLPRAA